MSETKHSTLLPCPFCGDIPPTSVLDDHDGSIISSWVACDCGVETKEEPTEEGAIKRWNTRAATSLHHELVSALEALYATVADDQEHCDDWVAEEDCSICKAYKHAAAVLAKAKQPNLEEPK